MRYLLFSLLIKFKLIASNIDLFIIYLYDNTYRVFYLANLGGLNERRLIIYTT